MNHREKNIKVHSRAFSPSTSCFEGWGSPWCILVQPMTSTNGSCLCKVGRSEVVVVVACLPRVVLFVLHLAVDVLSTVGFHQAALVAPCIVAPLAVQLVGVVPGPRLELEPDCQQQRRRGCLKTCQGYARCRSRRRRWRRRCCGSRLRLEATEREGKKMDKVSSCAIFFDKRDSHFRHANCSRSVTDNARHCMRDMTPISEWVRVWFPDFDASICDTIRPTKSQFKRRSHSPRLS